MSRWRANAKLTLSLRVLGVRDDGYHELDALVVSVSEPHDELDIRARTAAGPASSRRFRIAIDGPAAGDITAGADNLALRAARALLGDTAVVDVQIDLHKRVPAGGGLGGGSADAAAVLVALNDTLALGRTTDEVAALGAALGSDVPFCVHGGAASMRGRGEVVEPTDVAALHVVIAVPPFRIATPDVYRAWDALGGPKAERAVGAPLGLAAFVNDLEPAAEHVEPRVGAFRAALEDAAGEPSILAGSGSARAFVFADAADAQATRRRIEAAGIARLVVTGTTGGPGVERIEG